MNAIWERIGFTMIGIIAGAVYGLAFSVFAVFMLHKFTFLTVMKVFCGIFGFCGLVMGEKISDAALSSLYPMYYLYGVILGFFGIGGGLGEEIRDYSPKGALNQLLMAIGVVSVIICFFVN